MNNPIVLYTEVKFFGIDPCNNPKYSKAKFAFPIDVYGETINCERMSRPNQFLVYGDDDEIAATYRSLKPGTLYKVSVSVGVNQAKEKNGRTYDASANIRILKVTGERQPA